MTFQYILLFAIIALAAWYVIRKLWEPFRSKSACGACTKCQALDKIKDVKKG